MLYQSQPDEFRMGFEGVGCFMEYGDKILLLHRQDHKREGNTWGIPGGKVDAGEEILEAMVREIYEETELKISCENLSYVEKVYVKFPGYDFIYHMFKITMENHPDIKINNEEHKDFIWLSPTQTLKHKTLMPDLDACIKLIYGL